jgi:hypothetical protein
VPVPVMSPRHWSTTGRTTYLRRATLLVAVALPGLGGGALAGQQAPAAQPASQPAPERPKNLKILPKSLSRDSLVKVMRGMASALGVSCDHCHAPFADTTIQRLDYASDAKATKRVARDMMRMVSDINKKVDRALPDSARRTVMVQCISCHRAATRPQMLEDTLMHVVSARGAAAALAEYRALREKYYGRFIYDFGQRSLNVLATRLQEQGRDSAALDVLVLNGELFPKAWDIPFERARIHEQQGDTARAVALYRQVLALQPMHTRAKARLEALAPR